MPETSNDRPVVMVSSTALDLPEHRKEVLEACLRMGMFPVMMERLPASDAEAVSASLRMVDEADIYIGVFAYRYGYVPKENNLRHISVTEMEYERAVERKIPRLIFVIDKKHPLGDFTIDNIDKGEGAERLAQFKSRVEAENIVNYFKSPIDLRAHVINSLSQLRKPDLTTFHYVDNFIEAPKGHTKKPGASNKNRELMRVFIASPRDVQDERSRMPKVIDSINRTLGKLSNVVVELWRWESDAPPAAGEPQALINPELDQADVAIVIFWNRFGMRTHDGTTGTESEVVRSLKRWDQVGRPQVMMYFCQRPALLDIDELEQRAKVLNFRKQIDSLALALVVDYEAVSEFEWRVRDDLFLTLSRMLNQ
jgi:hypothetical protein